MQQTLAQVVDRWRNDKQLGRDLVELQQELVSQGMQHRIRRFGVPVGRQAIALTGPQARDSGVAGDV